MVDERFYQEIRLENEDTLVCRKFLILPAHTDVVDLDDIKGVELKERERKSEISR